MGSVSEEIGREVPGWPGVEERPHRFGGREFRVNGHLHGDRLADMPFPVKLREELAEAGKARRHHVLPETGWVGYPIREPEDVAGALEIFRKN